jgi:hypothetical protein
VFVLVIPVIAAHVADVDGESRVGELKQRRCGCDGRFRYRMPSTKMSPLIGLRYPQALLVWAKLDVWEQQAVPQMQRTL